MKVGILNFNKFSFGINSIIYNLLSITKNWDLFVIQNGIDGIIDGTVEKISKDFIKNLDLSNSFLSGNYSSLETFLKNGEITNFNKKLKQSITKLGLDAIIVLGDKIALSYEYSFKEVFSSVSLIHIPVSITNDIPLTENCIGFNSTIDKISDFCTEFNKIAQNQNKYFILQTFGENNGNLALYSGLLGNADAILLHEIKFDIKELTKHLLKNGKNSGIIVVSSGIKLRGHSGEISEIISRELSKLGISNKNIILDTFQILTKMNTEDKLLSIKYSDLAVDAIENKETFVMTSFVNKKFKTISIDEVFENGIKIKDNNYQNMPISTKCIEDKSDLLNLSIKKNIYIGEYK